MMPYPYQPNMPDWMKNLNFAQREQQQQQRAQVTGTPSLLDFLRMRESVNRFGQGVAQPTGQMLAPNTQPAQPINMPSWLGGLKYLTPDVATGGTAYSNYQAGKELMESVNYPNRTPFMQIFSPPPTQQAKVMPYGSFQTPFGQWVTPPQKQATTDRTLEEARSMLATNPKYAKYYNAYNPNAVEEPEDAMWRALNNAGLTSLMGMRTLQQMGGANWQRALLRSLTPITQTTQTTTPTNYGGGYRYPSYGGGGGGYNYPTPVYQNASAWAEGLVNWRIK